MTKLHAIVFCWPHKVADAIHICRSLVDRADKVTVIDASTDPIPEQADWEWIKVDPSCYFGHKFAHALSHFTGDVLLQIQADASHPNWGAVADLCRRRFAEIPRLGIWGPELDYTVWPSGGVQLYKLDDPQLAGVVQTDCIVWAMRSNVVNYLRRLDYSKNNLGWGIDWAAIAHCYACGTLVLRDSAAKISHPKGTGYDRAEADRQMAWFLNQIGFAEKIQYRLLTKSIKYKSPS